MQNKSIVLQGNTSCEGHIRVMGGLLSDIIIMVFIKHYALLPLYHGGSSMIFDSSPTWSV